MADHGIPQAAGAALGTWFLMFIAIFVAGAGAFVTGTVWCWWTLPPIGLTALACGAFAWRMRSRNPLVSAGVWVGIALGLTHAGLCFSSS